MEIKAKVRVQEGPDGERCPYCLDDVTSDDVASCDRCGTKHHASCFLAHGSCTILGCNGQALEAAGFLEESEQLAILEAAKSQSGNARVRAIERMLRDGVPIGLVEREFGQDSDRRVHVAILGTKLRHDNREAGHELIRMARDGAENFQIRAASLRALALQQDLPEGTIETALLCLEQGSLKNRAEWILRSCEREEMLAITVATSRGVVPGKTALKGLVATFSGFVGQERQQRLMLLRSLREDLQGDLAHVLLDAALAKSEILAIPNATIAVDNSELQSKFTVALVTGVLLSATLLTLAALLSQQAGEVHGPGLEVLWMIARSFTALSIAVVGGLGMILSSRKNRDLELKDRLRMRHQRAKDAFDKTMKSPVWTQSHVVGTAMHDRAQTRSFDPKLQGRDAPIKGQ